MKPAQRCLVALLIFFSLAIQAQTVLVPFGANWRYADSGNTPPINWPSGNLDDSNWKLGGAPLGYGNGAEATQVSYGPDINKKFITTYFRKTLNIPDVKVFNKFILELYRDDGAVIYVNGVQKFKTNMPTGTITNTTLASTIASDDGTVKKSFTLNQNDFVSGNNVIAIEIHQASATDDDLRFNFQLLGNKPPVAITATQVTLPPNSKEYLLDGRGSYDPDGKITKYQWIKVSGPTGATIAGPTVAQTNVTGLTNGAYVFQLKVTDNKSAIDTETLALTVNDPSMLLVDWSTLTLPTDGLPDARRFANDKLRSSTAYDPFSKTIVDGKMQFVVNSQVPVDPKVSSAKYQYRAEFTEWPWNINLIEGTEQWFGWSYFFAPDYVFSPKPISIFQNHPATSNGDPLFQLEIARPNQVAGAIGGEIQIINNAVSPYVRKLTSVRPMPGDRLDVIIHVVYGIGNQGLLQIWMNGQKVYDVISSTIYPAPENWGGNNKWGIYHHTWTSATNVEQCIAAGHTKFELQMGNLRQITCTPGDSDYGVYYKDVVDPAQDISKAAVSARMNTKGPALFESDDSPESFVYPVPLKSGESLFINPTGHTIQFVTLINQIGQSTNIQLEMDSQKINTEGISPGVYWLKWVVGERTIQKRIIIL
jgi:Polysaccharide lyase